MTLPLEEIEAKARAATQGVWEVSEARTVEGEAMVVGGSGQSFGLIAECPVDEDAAYIAFMNPQTALALVARVRELEVANRDQIIAAFEAGAQAVHEHHCPDRPDDGDFTEAACDYADSLP